MSSSILRSEAWRKLNWIAYALAGIAVIEFAVALLHPTTMDDRRNFFELRFGHQEVPDRILIAEKLRLFKDDRPTVLQVGDSSGFHGVMPPVVEALIPEVRYLNLNIFATQGYTGFYEVAKYIMQRNTSVRFLVLYTSPAGDQPRDYTVTGKHLIGDDIHREFNSPVHALLHLPSLGLREQVTDLAYYGTTGSEKTASLREAERYREAHALLPESGGWTREHDNSDDVAEDVLDWDRRTFRNSARTTKDEAIRQAGAEFGVSPTVFDWRHLRSVNMSDLVYERFRKLAEAHGAKLIIASAPVPDVFQTGEVEEKLTVFQTQLETYAKAHPDVGIVPLTFLPSTYFSSTVHVSTPYASEATRRFAQALRSALGAKELAALQPPAGPPRKTVRLIDMREVPPGYGFGPPLDIAGRTYRAMRNGRSEALLFARVPRDVSRLSIDFAPDIPQDLLAQASVSIGGEKAKRGPVCPEGPGGPCLTWTLPASVANSNGWLEILVSARGLTTWPGDQLTEGATGSMLKISQVRFD